MIYDTDQVAAVKYLNDYSNDNAQQMLTRWKALAIYLIVKYNDMSIKPEKDGKFARTKTGLGVSVARPGYPTAFAKKLAEETRDKFVHPEK